MRRLTILILFFALFLSCDKHFVEKPDNVIDQDIMIDILYDMAVLEALKTHNPNNLAITGINENTYIQKKYKVDSLQFSKSNKYYASDLHNYVKMYEKIDLRLAAEKDKTDTLVKKGINLNTKLLSQPTDSAAMLKKKVIKKRD